MFGNAEVVLTGISGKDGSVLFKKHCFFAMEDNTSALVRRDEICALVREHPDLVRVIIDMAI